MRPGKFVTFMMSLLLIASIGFMQYSLVAGNGNDLTATRHATIKQAQATQDLLNARDFNDDDDEDAALVKYSMQQFYNCDIFSALHFFISGSSHETASFSHVAGLPVKTSIYQQIHSYRI